MIRALVLLTLLVRGAAWSQEAPDTSSDSEGMEILSRLDARIYRATREGLKALSFTYRPRVEGEDPPDIVVRYRWRAGVGDRIDFLDENGEVLESPPKLPGLEELHRQGRLDDEPGRIFTTRMLTASRGLGLSARGVGMLERYGDFRVRVNRKVVNHEETVSLILEPRNPKKLRRLTITLDREGRPWAWERRYLDGSSVIQYHTFAEREGQWLLRQLQETVTPAGSTAGISYAYDTTFQKVQGILLPASITKESPALPDWARGRTELTDMKVNDDVPAFEPM
jgi:hypothetical protein